MDPADAKRFSELGKGKECSISKELLHTLEVFVCRLYHTKDYNQIESLSDLRWNLYKRHKNVFNLPPTLDAVLQKAKRAHYTACLWQCHLENCIQSDPEECGWEKISEKHYEPIMTSIGPAPEEVIHQSRCRCKTGCSTMRCPCRRRGKACSELCTPCEGDEAACENVYEAANFTDDDDDDVGTDEE
jgi:hypothetical protein